MTRSRVLPWRTAILLFACISAFAAAPLNTILTDDDGYAAPGIQILRRALVAAGHNAVIVAPRTNQSGRGTGVEDVGGKLNLQFHPAEHAWTVNGTPSDSNRWRLDRIGSATPCLGSTEARCRSPRGAWGRTAAAGDRPLQVATP